MFVSYVLLSVVIMHGDHVRACLLRLQIIDFDEDDNFSGGVYFSGNHKNTQWERFQTEVRPAIIFSLRDDGFFLHGATICEM